MTIYFSSSCRSDELQTARESENADLTSKLQHTNDQVHQRDAVIETLQTNVRSFEMAPIFFCTYIFSTQIANLQTNAEESKLLRARHELLEREKEQLFEKTSQLEFDLSETQEKLMTLASAFVVALSCFVSKKMPMHFRFSSRNYLFFQTCS